jgi:hypothetical protein
MGMNWGENWDLLALLPSALSSGALWTWGLNCGLMPQAELCNELVAGFNHHVV